MKLFSLCIIYILAFSASAMAGIIEYTTDTHQYSRWPDQMNSIVAAHEGALNQYLGDSLKCRSVKLQFNNLRSPTLFKKGLYNLSLSAKCNKSFQDFNLSVSYGYSLGEPIALKLSYQINGRPIEQIIELNERDD